MLIGQMIVPTVAQSQDMPFSILGESSTATSSTHAEYVAAAEAAKELIWLRRLLSELHEGTSGPTALHIDNWAADLLAQNPVNHAATKHIDIQYHFI